MRMDGGSLGGWIGDDGVDGKYWVGCVVDGVDQEVVRIWPSWFGT